MILFFDTETTGLPRDWKAPASDTGNWPRMIQLAWLLYDYEGNLQRSGNHIIKPEGFVIPQESTNIHGISTYKAMAEGEDLQSVLTLFANQLAVSHFVVAHNIDFDKKVIGAEFVRKGRPDYFYSKKSICTMESTTNYCAIPGPYGYKWPKLSELHFKLFGNHFMESHNAAVDINATAKCFWELKRRNILFTNIGTTSTSNTNHSQPPSNVDISSKVEYAGFWLRVLATIIDLIIVNLLALFVVLPFTGSVDNPKAVEGLARGIGLIIGWIYAASMESSKTQATLGKQMFGIIVTDENGDRISFAKATGRYFGKFISLIIVYIGFLMVAFTQKKQGLHDQMAGTLVVKK